MMGSGNPGLYDRIFIQTVKIVSDMRGFGQLMRQLYQKENLHEDHHLIPLARVPRFRNSRIRSGHYYHRYEEGRDQDEA